MGETIEKIELFFQEQPSDKVYFAAIVKNGETYDVPVEWGRRGKSLRTGSKALGVTLAEAKKAYDKVVRQKMKKGYEPWTEENIPAEVAPEEGQGSASKAGVHKRAKVGLAAQLLNPVDDDDVIDLIDDDAFVAQQKLDGKRLIVHVRDEGLLATNRSGQETSLPSKVANTIARAVKDGDVPVGTILDGELCAAPEVYWVFDLLALGDETEVREEEYVDRYDRLEGYLPLGKNIKLVPIAYESDEKQALFDRLMAQNAEGIVFKQADAPYAAGRPSSGGTQLKHKFVKSADVVLIKNAGNAYQMAVFDPDETDEALREIGKVFAGTTDATRETIDAALKAGETPVAEVRYLYATDSDNLYQPVFVRLREDKPPEACLLTQLIYTDRSVAD